MTVLTDFAGVVIGIFIALGITAFVNVVSGTTIASAEAGKFSYLKAAGASKSDLCLQATKTRQAYARQRKAKWPGDWIKIENDTCRGVKIEGPLPF